MSERARTSVVELGGPPDAWTATVRTLLEHVRETAPTREEAIEWWLDRTDSADPEAVADRLDFLATIGVLEAADGSLQPGPQGRALLEGSEPDALYAALTDAADGFEPMLEALAVRPVTDVEFADLLERDLDGAVAAEDLATPRRRWLQALDYLDHDGGVNDLTRKGRRLVETDDSLSSPADRSHAGSQDAESPPTGPDAASDGSTTADAEFAESSDPSDEPAYVVELRRRYDDTCAVCGDRRRRGPETGFSRVHHLMPLEEPHDGPAVPENAVVVCPNHRADLEHGRLTVDPETLEVTHAYERSVSGRTLRTTDDHEPGAQYLAYHDGVVADL